jgi:hypothetical protein
MDRLTPQAKFYRLQRNIKGYLAMHNKDELTIDDLDKISIFNDNIPQLRLSYTEESKYIEINDFTNLVPFIKRAKTKD